MNSKIIEHLSSSEKEADAVTWSGRIPTELYGEIATLKADFRTLHKVETSFGKLIPYLLGIGLKHHELLKKQ